MSEKASNWFQVFAIIIGLVIHGSVIGYQLGRLTQLVANMELRIIENNAQMAGNRDMVTNHLIGHPDKELDKRLTLLEKACLGE